MRKKPYDIEEETFFAGSSNVASANECTGLLSVPAQDEEQSESLSDIYDVPVTTMKKNKKVWEK